MNIIAGNYYETDEYDMFKPLEGNRTDYIKRAAKVIASIKKRGYILSPICINEKCEVVDGQARLEALQQLKMPVHYYIAEGAGIEDCIAMNIYGTKWSALNYAQSYAARGFEDYIRLMELKEKYPSITFNSIASISLGIRAQPTERIMNGTFKLPQERYESIKNILTFCEKATPHIKCVSGRREYIYMAFGFLLGEKYHGEFDENKMLDSLKKYCKEKMPQVSNITNALAGLSEIYNYRKKGTPVYFATEYDKVIHATKEMED